MNADRGYRVRGYEPGDEGAIQRVFGEVFGVERTLAEWRWKFLAPPRGSRILLAFDEAGELVCQYAAITTDVAWGGETLAAAQIVDVFSRRRRGLGRRGGAFQGTMERFLADCAELGGVGFVYGFPGDRHQRAGAATGRYFPPVEIDRLQRNLAASTVLPVSRRWVSEGFDAHAQNRLWQRSRHRYANATIRDAAWVEWRYERRPGGRYLHLGLRRGGELRAWAVLAFAGPEPARWLDLLWDGERVEDLADLVAAVEESARAHGASRVELWLRGDGEALAVLEGLGYSGAAEPHLRLSAIAFDPRVSVPQVLGSFYLTMGDCDHF
jgi:hypothetical protein